ncbi:hypothetical protein AAZX31_17G092900 [Glycine max]
MSHLMNKCETSLELFLAIWFVLGVVWVFDPSTFWIFSSNSKAPCALHHSPCLERSVLLFPFPTYGLCYYEFGPEPGQLPRVAGP